MSKKIVVRLWFKKTREARARGTSGHSSCKQCY